MTALKIHHKTLYRFRQPVNLAAHRLMLRPRESRDLRAKAGIWLRIFEALAAKSPQSLQLIDSSIIRAHQHAAVGKKGVRITPSAVLVED